MDLSVGMVSMYSACSTHVHGAWFLAVGEKKTVMLFIPGYDRIRTGPGFLDGIYVICIVQCGAVQWEKIAPTYRCGNYLHGVGSYSTMVPR